MTYNPFKIDTGAFGDNKFVQPRPVIQIDNRYGIAPANLSRLETFSATGGSADNNGNLFRVSSGTSVGGYGVLRSKQTINYRAGQSSTALFTAAFTSGVANSEQGAGLFNVTDGLLFGYNGANFSILHQYGGVCEVQTITISTTGTGSVTVTLNGVASASIALTNSSTAVNAYEILEGLEVDASLSPDWRFEAVNNTVICINKNVGDKTGTMSVSFSGATGSIATTVNGSAKTSNYIAQASWNSAPFSGFNPTVLNLYKIEFGYLGIANPKFYIYNPNTSKFELVHTIQWAGSGTTPILTQPNLKIGYYAASLGSSGTNLVVQGASACVYIDGQSSVQGFTYSTSGTLSSFTTTLLHILSLKNRVVMNNKYCLGVVKPSRVSFELDHTKGASVEIYINTEVAGSETYAYIDQYNSVALKETGGTTLTGGRLVASLQIPAGGSNSLDLSTLNLRLYPEDELTIAAKTNSGTATSITASLIWEEEF